MVKIECYSGDNNQALLKFLSTDDFMTMSVCPAENVIASIFDYQDKTNNYNQSRGSIMLNEKSEIVGFLGALAIPALYQSEKWIAVQTTSAFVNSAYPGNFKKIIKHYMETNINVPTFTVFPVPKIFSSFEKMGFVKVNSNRFKSNHYIVRDYYCFTQELFKNKMFFKVLSLPLALLGNIFLKNRVKHSFLKSELMNNFNNDYSKIENDYRIRTADLFVIDWSRETLENKYSNKINLNKNNIKENEVIHICCFDENQIVGSVVLKKVRNYERFIISDIQTTLDNRYEIVFSLINTSIMELKNFNFNSLMFFGIEEIYSDILLRRFKYFKKRVDKRVYYLPFKDVHPEKVSLVFSDDDLNY